MQRGAIRSLFDGTLKDIPFGAIGTGQGLIFDGTAIVGGMGNLLVDTDWYVSTTGNDTTGNGSQALPWATIARAWVERLKYGIILASLRIRLIGANTYTMPALGFSVVGAGGTLTFMGDPTARTLLFSGTFTGNIAAGVVGCAAGLGADTFQRRFVRILTGALAGAIFQIHTHTDTTITPMQTSAWSTGATANGNQFEVFLPLTTITIPAGVGPTDWIGGSAATEPLHGFFNLRINSPTPTWANACVYLCAVDMNVSQRFSGCELHMSGPGNAFFLGIGPNSVSGFLKGAGVYTASSGLDLDFNTYTLGVLGIGALGTFSIGRFGPQSYFQPTGMRCLATTDFRTGIFRAIASSGSGPVSVEKTLNIGFGMLAWFQQLVTFTVTAGDALFVKDGGEARFETAPAGGTSAAASFGCRVSGASRISFKNITPTLTGGTAAVDLKVDTTAGVANATLNANNTSRLDPVTAGVIYRTA